MRSISEPTKRGCSKSHLALRSSVALAAMIAGGILAEAEAAPADLSQGADAQAAESGSPDEIVVTARRTRERASDVPVSVSALNANALAERNIATEADLQAATPGLTVRETNSSNQLTFSLRGQSVDAFSFAAPAVLAYVNEFSEQGAAASTFYDLDSIQVLKGPQGTLFGRNATGGAVLYQTVRPDTERFGGYAKLGFGNFNGHLGEGALNFPIEKLGAFRISGQLEERDGFQHNLLLGTTNGAVDEYQHLRTDGHNHPQEYRGLPQDDIEG